ncbi:hypothetical protein M378DRAFT_529486 [Amanita muscaria Koide BX008]|uniref:Uncharacterized protein n=1 Tax=Amanita muscaria (strain Koide BX008) TaxID=946122 RepID=A0A0C2X835_AMAMK|nr:hypothetical protein M378DRAFT_529486 [Amanita muscaria Koide BX008]
MTTCKPYRFLFSLHLPPSPSLAYTAIYSLLCCTVTLFSTIALVHYLQSVGFYFGSLQAKNKKTKTNSTLPIITFIPHFAMSH